MNLPAARFHQLIADAPLVSIDLVVVDETGRLLLGLRRNAPASGSWFVPGGRVRKGELLANAMRRLLVEELGQQAEMLQPEWLGCYEHHYSEGVAGADCPTHYVVLAHRVTWPMQFRERLPREQHADYRWQALAEVASAHDVHVHSRWYAQDLTGVPRCPRSYP